MVIHNHPHYGSSHSPDIAIVVPVFHDGELTVLTATGQLMDYTERVLRQRIAEIPDGEYRAEGFLDDDGRNRNVRLPIKVCVRVRG